MSRGTAPDVPLSEQSGSQGAERVTGVRSGKLDIGGDPLSPVGLAAPQPDAPPRRSMAANILSLGTSQLITWSMALLWTFFVPRLIGPEDMGLFVIATSVTAVVAVVLSITPKDFLVREMVNDRSRAPRILATGLTLRLAAVPMVFLAATAYGQVAGLEGRAMAVLYLAAGGTVCTMLVEPALSAFQATERMQFIAYTDVANKSLQTFGGVALVLAGYGVVAISGFSLLVAIVSLTAALVWVNRILGLGARPLPPVPVVREAGPYWFVAVFFVAYLWADGFLLGLLAPPEVVGWYGAATRLFTTMMFVAVIISTAALPRLVAAHAQAPARLFEVARTPFEWVIILGLALGVGLACIADQVIQFLYGAAYSGAEVPLMLLGLCLPFMYVNIMVSQLFVASGRPMMLAWTLAAAAAVNVGLNLVLIPFAEQRWDNGAIGAAASLLLTEFVQMILGMLLIGRRLLTRRTVARIAGSAAAAAGMAALLEGVLDSTPFPIQVVVGAATFVLIAIILRVPNPEDQVRAADFVRRARARLVRPRSG